MLANYDYESDLRGRTDELGRAQHVDAYDKHPTFLESPYAGQEDLLRDVPQSYMDGPPPGYGGHDAYEHVDMNGGGYDLPSQPQAQTQAVDTRRLSKDRLARGGLNIFSWNTDAPTLNHPREVRERDCAELQRLRPVDSAAQRDKEVREKFEGNTQSRFLCFSESDSPGKRRGVRVFNPNNKNGNLNSGTGHENPMQNRFNEEPQPFKIQQQQPRPLPQQNLPPAGRATHSNRQESGGIPGFAGMGEGRQHNARRGRGSYRG
ncbi:hypothetical protein, conserved [Trypanosoma brucei gambiense DAL972]|uniref:Uncharacterized protein n=1 Tax=Trypanosoma brucei gambiense (strain MHOM/CI/86/DAL972) TaxID=679716 RepID=D0A7W2_TRYB9|nr:hypothetical protein, conserved [Trypanosoma brucei gambiense DAL972]CBH17763.1 hypothetical protein, conserved [Trypanosoma brucei gambiense DAL972]|eukprot:XP_011780027.1 hypothetical protein, conserved [Trypanosoma brucei gambiense DAL972]